MGRVSGPESVFDSSSTSSSSKRSNSYVKCLIQIKVGDNPGVSVTRLEIGSFQEDETKPGVP